MEIQSPSNPASYQTLPDHDFVAAQIQPTSYRELMVSRSRVDQPKMYLGGVWAHRTGIPCMWRLWRASDSRRAADICRHHHFHSPSKLLSPVGLAGAEDDDNDDDSSDDGDIYPS